MARKKLIDKKAKKYVDGECLFCKEGNRALLDVHRIVPGSEGGQYTAHNSVTACSNCHRRIHAGEITILQKRYSTSGLWRVQCVIEGETRWL